MNPYILLAKSAVESYIKDKEIISVPDNLPEDFYQKRSGTFVTIEKNGELRGCIGTYLATKANIAEEIIHNAIAAATEDYRFGPIQKEELPDLFYTVYILSKPVLVRDFCELAPKKYGIIVKTLPIEQATDVVFNGHLLSKTGLLLPDLEGIDTAEQQLSIAAQKAGIDLKREKIIIYRFTAEKFNQ